MRSKGYLGGNKLSLVVPPAYAEEALRIYSELDKNEYFRVAVLDTEKAGKDTPTVLEDALCEEVEVRRRI